MIEAGSRLETQFRKKQKVNLWKAATGVTKMHRVCERLLKAE